MFIAQSEPRGRLLLPLSILILDIINNMLIYFEFIFLWFINIHLKTLEIVCPLKDRFRGTRFLCAHL